MAAAEEDIVTWAELVEFLENPDDVPDIRGLKIDVPDDISKAEYHRVMHELMRRLGNSVKDRADVRPSSF